MKNKKWISLAAAVVLAVTALPMTAFAAKKHCRREYLLQRGIEQKRSLPKLH